MAISDRINEMYTHVGDVYDTITNVDLPTNKNIQNIPSTMRSSYLEIMNNGIDKIWNNWEKVTGSGTSISLSPTIEAPMRNVLNGNTYQSTTILPSEYTQVEYIESTGTQYIDTGVNADNNMSIDIDFQFTLQGTASYENCFGVINGDGQYYRYHFETRTANSLSFSYYHNNLINFYEGFYTDRVRIFVDMPNLKCQTWKNGVSQLNVDLQDFGDWDSQLNFWLFRRNSNNTNLKFFSKNRIYHCKMYASGVLVRDFIPCYRNSDNVIGLYDYVNKVFYINQGTGDFVKGNNVTTPTSDFPTPSPDYPQNIHVVSGNNTIKVKGKNLFNIEGRYETGTGITYTKNDDGSYTLNGTANGNNFLRGVCHLDEQHILSYTSNVSNSNVILRTRTGTPSAQTGIQDQLFVSSTSGSLASSKKFDFVEISIVNGTTLNNFKIYIQLEKGNQVTNFEPYSSDLYSVDLPVENLLQLPNGSKTTNGVTATITNGKLKIAGTTTTNWFSICNLNIPLESGTYTFSYTNKKVNRYNFNIKYADNTTQVIYGNAYSNTPITLNQNATITGMFSDNNATGATFDYEDYLMIEKGSKANSYTPYGTTPIELCDLNTYKDNFLRTSGKNLFNSNITPENYYYDNNGEKVYQSGVEYINQEINNVNYTSIIISFLSSTGGASVRVCEYNLSGVFIARTLVNTNNQVVNLNNATTKIILSVNSDSNSYFTYLMINKGSTATEYEPYGSGEWYKYENINKIILNGTQNITLASGTPRRFNATYTTLGLTNIKEGTSAEDTTLRYRKCDHFIYSAGQVTWGRYYLYNNWLVMLDNGSVIASANDLKTWLSINNTKIYYVLATPNYIKITYEPLLEQLEAFYNAKSKNSQTNISQENNDLPFILDVTALKQLN